MSDASSPPGDVPPPTRDGVVHDRVGGAPDGSEHHALLHPRPPRPGELSPGWRAVTAGTWIGVVLGLAAVWNTSVQLGLSTWWLGPRAEPQLFVQFIPFLAPAIMLLITVYQVRYSGWYGLAAAAALGGVAAGDVARVTSLAVVEFAIAGAAALVSIASFTGTYRQAETGPAATDTAATSL